ncbi:Eukaryotic translation initiation factor 3 subunit M [Halotydeus destructor]|nr:Eukaryotic translation initiation factor 3 subunit M [Halotydeus destructor]
MTIPGFIDASIGEQCEELRQYLVECKANISVDNKGGELSADLEDIISAVPVLFTEDVDDNDLENVLNSIVSMLILVPAHDAKLLPLITSFCDKLVSTSDGPSGLTSLRVLQNLFEGFSANKAFRYEVYFRLLSTAGKTNYIHLVPTEIDKIKEWFSSLGIDKLQNVYRHLHGVLIKCKHTARADKVMVELLGTYTEETASQARDDAQRCIISSLADSSTFLLDNLLSLKPVKTLKGEKIYELLNIFVSEKLQGYVNFYKANQSFVDSLGLSHDQNIKKMRLLTFMQLAENAKEITFASIQQELQLSDNTVEPFIIDVLKTKLVRAKIDQVNRKVLVSSTMHRTFGTQQWEQLRETLSSWQINLKKVEHTIGQALRAQHAPQISA